MNYLPFEMVLRVVSEQGAESTHIDSVEFWRQDICVMRNMLNTQSLS